MTKEELKRALNYQYQLSTFAIGLGDDMKDHGEWVEFSKQLAQVSIQMLRKIDTTMTQINVA